MNRLFTIVVAFVCLSLGAFLLPALSQAPEKAKAAPAPRADRETLAIMRLLEVPIETKGLQDVTLKTALEYIASTFAGKLPILIDKEAFLAAAAEAPDLYEEKVSLPTVPQKMATERVLRMIIAQSTKGVGTFVIRKSLIEITTHRAAQASNAQYRASIMASFERRALPEALQELSNQTGQAINLDPNIGEKSSTLINATFRNGSLEEALVTVTEMAKLKYVVLERSIYVTTPGHAELIERDEAIRTKKRIESLPKSAEGAR